MVCVYACPKHNITTTATQYVMFHRRNADNNETGLQITYCVQDNTNTEKYVYVLMYETYGLIAYIGIHALYGPGIPSRFI